MIRFWVRELMGWVLVVIGLGIFYLCFAMLLRRGEAPLIIEAPAISVIGIVVFRGGIHLLKVAVAARLAMQVPAEAAKPIVSEKRKTKIAAPLDW
jgi:hypothetical protein